MDDVSLDVRAHAALLDVAWVWFGLVSGRAEPAPSAGPAARAGAALRAAVAELGLEALHGDHPRGRVLELLHRVSVDLPSGHVGAAATEVGLAGRWVRVLFPSDVAACLLGDRALPYSEKNQARVVATVETLEAAELLLSEPRMKSGRGAEVGRVS